MLPRPAAALLAGRWRAAMVLLAAALAALAVTGPARAQDADTVVFGTIRVQGEPVANVKVTVQQDGEEVGEAATDDTGQFSVTVPAGGTYQVVLDTESLPEGLAVREERFATQEVTVEEGARKAVLFPIVETAATGGGSRWLARVLSLLVSGIQLGAVIAITSIGLSLIFGVTGLVNFAHGEMVTFGALVAFWLNAPPGASMHLIPAALVAIAAGGGLGFAMERGIFGPLRRRRVGLIALLVISIGLSIFIRYLFLVFYGGQSRPYRQYTIPNSLAIGPLQTSGRELVVIAISVAVLAAIGVLLQRTRLGTAMRAVADNRDLAESSGIDVRRVVLLTWIAGGALAAYGGIMQGVTQGITWDMGFKFLLLMFAGVILGGLGTAFGAMVGGLVIGIVTQLSTLWFSVEMKLVFAFLVLIVALLIRPQGILGRRERIG